VTKFLPLSGRQSHNSYYLVHFINELLRILINLGTMEIWRIHPSEVFYPCHRRTHFWFHRYNVFSIFLSRRSLRQHLESGSEFDMSHFLGQRINRNLRKLRLHILTRICSHIISLKGHILKCIGQNSGKDLYRDRIYGRTLE